MFNGRELGQESALLISKEALEVWDFFNFWYLVDVIKLYEWAGTCYMWNLGYGNFINRKLINKVSLSKGH